MNGKVKRNWPKVTHVGLAKNYYTTSIGLVHGISMVAW